MELDMEKQREHLEEQKTVERRNQYWAKLSYEESVEQHLKLISLRCREESVVKRREDLAKQRTRHEIEAQAFSRTRLHREHLRQEHMEREIKHEKDLDLIRAEYEAKLHGVESEIQLEKERRERCRRESSSDGLSHLAKLRVLEDSFERRLREKELQENIGIGLVLRQNLQLQLKEQREHLNLQFRNRWREIVESHVTDIEDSELGIDKDYLCLLRDREDIDDSDLSLMTNVHVKKKDSSRSLDDSSGEYHSMPFGLWRSTTIKDSKQSNAMKRWLNTSFLGECL